VFCSCRQDDVGGSGSDSEAASDEEAQDMEVADEEDYADLTGAGPSKHFAS
jgi:hypothetical protein